MCVLFYLWTFCLLLCSLVKLFSVTAVLPFVGEIKMYILVNAVYDSERRRYAEENRTEFNCTHWQILSRSDLT